MASFVGFAKKHALNTHSKAQERESNHGGKLADDHFQRLFLGGAVKRSVAVSVITPEAGGVFGLGTATVYTLTQDVAGGPPIQTASTETIYNATTTTFRSGDVIDVVDTGRGLVIVSPTRFLQNGAEQRTYGITTYDSTVTHQITAAEALAGVLQKTSGGAVTFISPIAADLVAAIPGAIAGTAVKLIIANSSPSTITISTGTGGIVVGSPMTPIATLTTKEITMVLYDVGVGTEGYIAYTVKG